MTEVNEPKTWREELASLLGADASSAFAIGDDASARESESAQDQMIEFMKGAAEMVVELGKACRDLVRQNALKEDSYIVKKLERPCRKVAGKLRFLNECLPEDRDPVHSWSVICFVSVLAFTVLNISSESVIPAPLLDMHIHPPNANLIVLPDGRHLAYQEQGVSANRARFSIIAPHKFLSSRLAGIPGIKVSLLEEFGVRLVTYDLPGFGESDPHPTRNLQSSALDMSLLANAVGIDGNFWVVGHSSGSIHAWAALRHIPNKLAGVILVSPFVNPYDQSLTKEERAGIWDNWTSRRKLMYFLARKFPRLLSYFYNRTFLSRKHGQLDKWLSLTLGKKDRIFIEEPRFIDFWKRDVEESVRQGDSRSFVEEAVLQVSNWGFSISDLKIREKVKANGVLFWLKSMYIQPEEERTGFLGPIHVWQGSDDKVVPPAMADFVHRVLPLTVLHKLPHEGHFTYFYFCDECHRQILTMIFGSPQGPLNSNLESQTSHGRDMEDTVNITLDDTVQLRDSATDTNLP